MVFSRNAFFFLLFLVLTLPFLLPNIIWLLNSKKTTGVVEGIGTATGVSFGRDTYAYVSFTVNNQAYYFQGMDHDYKAGDKVVLRYQKKNPKDAKIVGFFSLWGKTIAYCGAPLIFWLISFFAYDLIPKRSQIRLGKKPFFKVIPFVKTRG